MSCERYEGELTLAAIGTPVSAELERHLGLCPACRSRLERERRVLENVERGLRDALCIEPSPGFEARLLVAARHSRRAATPSSRLLRLPVAMLAAGLGFLLVWGWFTSRSRGPVVPPQAAAVPAAPRPATRESASESGVAAAEPPRPAALPSSRTIRTGASPRETEVLLPPGREEALVQFVAMLRDPRVAPPKALTDVTDPQLPLPDPEPLEIPDLETKPPSDPVPLDGRSQS